MSEDEKRPCPHCGGPTSLDTLRRADLGYLLYRRACDCGVSGPWMPSSRDCPEDAAWDAMFGLPARYAELVAAAECQRIYNEWDLNGPHEGHLADELRPYGYPGTADDGPLYSVWVGDKLNAALDALKAEPKAHDGPGGVPA